MRTKRMHVCWVTLLIAMIAWSGHASVDSTPQAEAASYTSVFLNAEALDSCQYFSASKWNSVFVAVSNLWGVGFYLGGVTADEVGCYEPSSSWISSLSQSWTMEPIWDGLQASCSGNDHRMSSDPDTAASQGVSEADSAVTRASQIGLGQGIVIYYDMESYGSSCDGPVGRFIDGWVRELHNKGDFGGVYGSVCNQPLDNYNNDAYVPDDVAIGDWNGEDSAYDVHTNCVSSDNWHNNRIHQYTQNSSVSENGVTLSPVDHECVRGDMDGESGWDNYCVWPG